MPALILLALGVAVVWITLTPLSWDNDELGHYWTARDIYARGSLPPPEDFPSIMLPRAPHPGAGQFRYHALPPTYYLALAGLFHLQPADAGGLPYGALAGRGFSALLYVIAVIAVYRMARLLAGGDERAAAFLAAGFALIPQVASTGASITADALALTAACLTGWACAHAAARNWDARSAAFVGLAAALVVMSRPTALAVLLVPAVLFAMHAGRDARRWVATGLPMAGLTLLPNSWWLIRSFAIHGEPFGSTAHVHHMATEGVYAATNEFALYKGEPGWFGLPDLLFSTDWLWRFHTRLWFTGRYEDLGLLGWVLAGALAICLGIAVATALGIVRPRSSSPLHSAARATPLALLAALIATGLPAALTSREYGTYAVGRFSTPALGLFLAATIGVLVTTRWAGCGRSLAAAFAASMAVIHLVFLAGFLIPDLAGEVLPP